VQDVAERSRDKSNMLQGYGDTVLRAEALEEQLVKSRRHAAAMHSKLDAAFAKYHNNVMELQAKGDDLVRKNKGLRNKNKGIPLNLSCTCWKSRSISPAVALLCCRARGPGGAAEGLGDEHEEPLLPGAGSPTGT
jgi:hypothetical protein